MCLVIIGSLFLLNVVLAILSDSLDKAESVKLKQDNKKKVSIAISVKRVTARLSGKQL